MVNYREFSIGSVAKMLNLPVHTIRFWTETFDHIEYLKRNGRRYYDSNAIEELKKIKELSKKKGLKIEGIKQIIRYKKIDMEKLNEATMHDFQEKIQHTIKVIDKIINVLKSV